MCCSLNTPTFHLPSHTADNSHRDFDLVKILVWGWGTKISRKYLVPPAINNFDGRHVHGTDTLGS